MILVSPLTTGELYLQKWLLPRVSDYTGIIDSRAFSSGLHRFFCRLAFSSSWNLILAVIVQELVC